MRFPLVALGGAAAMAAVMGVGRFAYTPILPAVHADCVTALDHWYRLTERANWRNVAEVKACFPAIDKVGDKFVFDIGGNKLRLIAAIHFNAGGVFVRAVLTHREYGKGNWK